MRTLILLAALCGIVCFNWDPQIAVGGDTPIKVINLEKLNTAGDEEDPCPAAEGLLFARKGKKDYDLYLSKRATASAPFGPGTAFLADRGADVRAPFAYQGKYYFATNEVPDEKFAKLKNFDLMLQVGKQRAEAIITNDINTKADEMYPWIGAGGKEFYFSRMTVDGWKLFVVSGVVPGPAKAKDVGFPAGFHRATMAGASLTMYLQGPLEDGKIGIYRSKRDKIGSAWSKPEPMTALNHPDSKKGDMQPALSADAARLYFVSDRPGGKGGLDIWSVTTIQLK
jgi:hypothetical protein